jgi:hypothetical protein
MQLRNLCVDLVELSTVAVLMFGAGYFALTVFGATALQLGMCALCYGIGCSIGKILGAREAIQ